MAAHPLVAVGRQVGAISSASNKRKIKIAVFFQSLTKVSL